MSKYMRGPYTFDNKLWSEPWKVDQFALTKQYVVSRRVRDFNDTICKLEPAYDCKEVANLIAAAPELLDAVRFLVEFCSLGKHDKNDPAIKKIYAALAKAEGKE